MHSGLEVKGLNINCLLLVYYIQGPGLVVDIRYTGKIMAQHLAAKYEYAYTQYYLADFLYGL